MKRVVKLIISLLYFLSFLPGRLITWLLGRKSQSTYVIFYYHSLPSGKISRFSRQMDVLLRWAKPLPANVSGPLEPGRRYAAVTFDDGFLSVVENALPELEKRGIPSTVFIISDFLGKVPAWSEEYSDGEGPDRIVTLEELLKMPSELVVIGSHTMTHPRLTTVSPGEALRELVESRAKLEKWLGKRVELFSFPYGAFNEKLVGLCREAGYCRVFTTLPKLALASREEFETGRVPVDLSDWDIEFLLKLFGAYRWLPYAFSLKRAIRSVLGLPREERRAQDA